MHPNQQSNPEISMQKESKFKIEHVAVYVALHSESGVTSLQIRKIPIFSFQKFSARSV
jgi:hypothetical protein